MEGGVQAKRRHELDHLVVVVVVVCSPVESKQKIKFRKGKGQEKDNLKMVLQRYEYFAQNCYPRLCFKDFVLS